MVSCSKEDSPDDPSKDPVTQSGGEISRSQLVTVNLADIALSENEYQGTLDGVAVTLTKSEGNKLLFLLPFSTTLGVHTLVIPVLNNTTVSYDVKDTVLSGTPDAAMTDFFANLNTFSQTLDASPEAVSVRNSLNVFKTYYANATIAEKTEMAVLYNANKVQFDEIFLYDFNNINVTGRLFFFEKAKLAVAKHARAVALMASGVALITVGSPVVVGLGAAIAITGAYKAYKANAEAVDNLVATIGTEFGGFWGISNKKTNTALSSVLTFSDNVSNQFSFNVMQRGVIASDKSKTEPLAQEYFKSYDMYNYNVNKDNIGIEKINKDKGTTYSSIPLEILPATNTEVKTIVNSEIFKNIKFAITDPNLTLVSVALEKDGQLNVKVKISESSSLSVVESYLNYTYEDEFNKMSGKLPIKVERTLVGTWKLESFDGGILPGQYGNFYHDKCANISYEKYSILNETITFTESAFTENSSWEYILFNKAIDVSTCIVTMDSPDTQWVDNTSSSGTYKLNNGVLEAYGKDGLVETSVSFISGNKIKIDDDIYVRQ